MAEINVSELYTDNLSSSYGLPGLSLCFVFLFNLMSDVKETPDD